MLLQPILATLWQSPCLPAAPARQLLPPRMSASPQALFERGRDEMQAGQLRAARDSFAALLELEPHNTVAQQIMARFEELQLPEEQGDSPMEREAVSLAGLELQVVGRGREAQGTCGAHLWASAPALVEWVQDHPEIIRGRRAPSGSGHWLGRGDIPG